jgi:YgiT-type zinc finger domain-containing protein
MKTNVTPTKELCAVCGGELRHTTITHEEKRGEHRYLFEHVPAQVCSNCGELWVKETTFRQIDQLIREGKPAREVQIPVYEFAVSSAR